MLGFGLPLLTGPAMGGTVDLKFDHKFGDSIRREESGTNYPSGVSLNSTTGDVFVMDLLNNRIKRFDAAGELVTQWVCRQGLGVTVDPRNGIVWVAMWKNHSIRAYSPDGTLLLTLGTEGKVGKGPGEFRAPHDLSIDPLTGDLYVMDTGNKRVQVFRTTLATPEVAISAPARTEGRGKKKTTIPAQVNWEKFWLAVYLQNFEGDLTEVPNPSPLAKSLPEAIAELQQMNASLSKDDYTPVVEYSREFTLGGTDKASQFQQPFGIAVHPGGEFVVVANTANREVVKFALDGTVLARWKRPSAVSLKKRKEGVPMGSEPGEFRWPRNVAVDAAGFIYVADTDNERVQKLDSDGNFVSFVMGPNDRERGSFHPRALDVDPETGAVVATASYANRIDRFDADGTYVSSFGVRERKGPRFNTLKGIAIHPESGDVYLSDWMDHRIRRYDARGRFVGDFDVWIPEQHTLDGEQLGEDWFTDPTRVMWTAKEDQGFPGALSFDAEGRLWLTRGSMHYDDDPRREADLVVRAFDADGKYLEGFGNDDFPRNARMRGLMVDPDAGHLYIANSMHNTLMKFDLSGTLIWSVGEKGNGPEQFDFPTGISMDPETGRIFVVDSRNSRVHVLNTSGEFLTTWGTPGAGEGQFTFSDFSGLAWDPAGYLFVADSRNHRVQVLDTEGAYVSAHGEKGFGGIGRYNGFTDLAVHDGKLYVLDNAGAEVEVYNITY
jgi:DNA-binding beta-propeller fold protein YncE